MSQGVEKSDCDGRALNDGEGDRSFRLKLVDMVRPKISDPLLGMGRRLGVTSPSPGPSPAAPPVVTTTGMAGRLFGGSLLYSKCTPCSSQGEQRHEEPDLGLAVELAETAERARDSLGISPALLQEQQIPPRWLLHSWAPRRLGSSSSGRQQLDPAQGSTPSSARARSAHLPANKLVIQRIGAIGLANTCVFLQSYSPLILSTSF